MSERTERLLKIAAEIIALEAKLEAKKQEFSAVATGGSMRVGDRGRPTMRTRILELFIGSVELRGAEVKSMLPQFSPSSLDVAIGRCVVDGLLERVRWGVYRKATSDAHVPHDSHTPRAYGSTHDAHPAVHPPGVGTGSVPRAGAADASVDAERAASASVPIIVEPRADDPATEEPEPR